MKPLTVGTVLIHAVEETNLTGTVFATIAEVKEWDIVIEYPDGKRRLVPAATLYRAIQNGLYAVEVPDVD